MRGLNCAEAKDKNGAKVMSYCWKEKWGKGKEVIEWMAKDSHKHMEKGNSWTVKESSGR